MFGIFLVIAFSAQRDPYEGNTTNNNMVLLCIIITDCWIMTFPNRYSSWLSTLKLSTFNVKLSTHLMPDACNDAPLAELQEGVNAHKRPSGRSAFHALHQPELQVRIWRCGVRLSKSSTIYIDEVGWRQHT